MTFCLPSNLLGVLEARRTGVTARAVSIQILLAMKPSLWHASMRFSMLPWKSLKEGQNPATTTAAPAVAARLLETVTEMTSLPFLRGLPTRERKEERSDQSIFLTLKKLSACFRYKASIFADMTMIVPNISYQQLILQIGAFGL
mmetsp:Transcript_24877/g.40692  ORF Transcript_24877/g.40692 Transcript_24877/m.40692 type:complete len:144 (-) Transcript_24877:64-495(-)